MDYAQSTMMLSNPNTKPTGGPTLQKKTDCVIGAQFYPPTDSDHFPMLFVKDENFVYKQQHKK
eukprot:9765567-Ditylum_brightwellii.AAC.1